MNNKKDGLGDRMKMYEGVAKTVLMKKTPVIIRIDGKAFHTFTRGFVRPFDKLLMTAMQETTKYLCENIQGCVLGYTQSDEITLVLCDYQTYDTSAWFDYEVQKLCSITASMATMKFNTVFNQLVDGWYTDYMLSWNHTSEDDKLNMVYGRASNKGAMFDARCFNVPMHEVENVLIWRQQDATRNSIQMVAQSNFSHKSLQGKSCNMLQEMLHEEKGINWNDFPTSCKRGTTIVKNQEGEWIIDNEAPIFTQDREYIKSRITFED